MNDTPSAGHLKRYKDICLLLWRYGHADIVRQMGDDAWDAAEMTETGKVAPEQLVDDLESMGPTFVKLGQVFSGRPDLLPEAYLKALERLQDNVKPFAWSEVEQIVTDELGVRINAAFASFEQEPMAAASLGQVHAAVLHDGRPVVVKVQRPGIVRQIADDFILLARIAEFLDKRTELGRRYRFGVILEELRHTLRQELDYEREARNMITIGRNLEGFPLIQIPQPVSSYSTRRVLTMDYINGRKITALGPLGALELDGAALAEELFRAYLQQVLVDGIFHADPHAGNVFITVEGRIALLDLGMVGRTTPAMQENLLKILLAISEGRSDQATDIAIRISESAEDADTAEFRRGIVQLLVLYQDQDLQRMNIGRTLLQMNQLAGRNGLYLPGELILLGKTLLQLDEVGRILDPGFNTSAAVRRHVSRIMSQRLRRDSSQVSLMNSLLEFKKFVTGMPERVNRILDAVANNELEIRINTLDAKLVMEGLHKIANRITTGIILAALIIGASLLMQVETAFRILGYPGLAMIFFLTAAAGSLWLIINIIVQDRRSEK